MEGELTYLRERVNELEEENSILKESLEELINVNKELTESIEEYNQDNNDNSYQQDKIMDMQNTIEAMNQEIIQLRSQGPHSDHQDTHLSEGETESLVNVLEELIESFKNMQNRYESEIMEYQTALEQFKAQAADRSQRLEDEYRQKLLTLEPIISQMHRQHESFAALEQLTQRLEAQGPALPSKRPFEG